MQSSQIWETKTCSRLNYKIFSLIFNDNTNIYNILTIIQIYTKIIFTIHMVVTEREKHYPKIIFLTTFPATTLH